MLVVVSDTHGRSEHRLEGRTLTAVRSADCVVHAGDFVTERVLDAFAEVCAEAGASFHPVSGNSDPRAVRRRIPAERTVAYAGHQFAVAHGHEHTDTTLPLFGRATDADCVIVGHTHRPSFGEIGDVPALNPGSYADPRGNRPGHAELVPAERDRDQSGGGAEADHPGGDCELPALDGRLVTPAGETIDRFRLRPRAHEP